MQPLLLAFAFGNFVIGTGVMLVVAMLNELAAGLEVTVSQAGGLVGAAGIALFIGAPLAAAFTSGVERHRLLIGALLLSGLGHMLCAMAPNYTALLPLRMVAVLGAAVFTPQAAVTIGLIAPPEQRGRAIVTIFMGWSVASVFGMPMGSFVAGLLGWRAGFVVIGTLTLLAAALVARYTPKGLSVPRMSPAVWRGLFRNRSLLLLLLVTMLTLAGQFSLQSYMAPVLTDSLGVTSVSLSLYFLWYGTCALIGNLLTSRYIGRLGAGLTSVLALIFMLCGMLGWTLTHGAYGLTLVMLGLLAIGSFATGSSQQVRAVTIDPAVASAAIALNTAVLYAGQGLGATIGGDLIDRWGYGALPWLGALLLLGALSFSVWLWRRGH